MKEALELSQLIAWREFPGHSTEKRAPRQSQEAKLGELRIQAERLRRPGQLEFSGENCTERGSFRGFAQGSHLSIQLKTDQHILKGNYLRPENHLKRLEVTDLHTGLRRVSVLTSKT